MPGNRRDHKIEGIGGITSMRAWIGKGSDDVQELDD
jgi:hypothetical protein